VRQPNRPYLQHGSRHGVNGSDPIPSQIQFAALRLSSVQTVPGDSADHYLDMEDGSTGIFETSDEAIFENDANAGLSGSPYGIKCLANGTYIVKENYFVYGGTVGTHVTCYHTFSGGTISHFQFGRTAALIGDSWDIGSSAVHVSFEEWNDATVSFPAPFFVNPYVVLASGVDVTVDAQTMVVYLSSYAGGNI
jgi:hypothetical protein